MAKSYNAQQVISGNFGEVTIDGDYMAEVTGLEATVTLDTTDVNMTGRMAKGTKVTGLSGSGTVTLNKVSSYFITKLSDNMKKGVTTGVTITSSLADPNSDGKENITLKNCIISEMSLANWSAGNLVEESIPFTFDDWEITSTIADVQ